MAFAQPDRLVSRNRSVTIENRAIRYATNAKIQKNVQTTSQMVLNEYSHF